MLEDQQQLLLPNAANFHICLSRLGEAVGDCILHHFWTPLVFMTKVKIPSSSPCAPTSGNLGITMQYAPIVEPMRSQSTIYASAS